MENKNRFVIELHVGKRYGIGRMNCDSTGRNKDINFNNKKYYRISSQSKKYAWRNNMQEFFNDAKTYKTCYVCDLLETKLKELESDFLKTYAADIAKAITSGIIVKENAMKKNNDKTISNKTAQVLVITDYDIQDIIDTVVEILKTENDVKSFLKGEKSEVYENVKKGIMKKLPLRQNSVDCALFGRMSTSGIMETVESSVCVNHSFSLGKFTNSEDYFIVSQNYVAQNSDDDASLVQQGAGYLDSKDLSSGHVYYEYTSIDVTHFYNNLCKGIDMSDEKNKERVKIVLKEHVLFLIDAILSAAPKGAQNAFATSPLPIGAFIRIRDLGQNITADNFCLNEIEKTDTEDIKFLNAMNNFAKYSKSNYRHYIKDIWVSFADDLIADCGENMIMSDAIDTIGDLIDERF